MAKTKRQCKVCLNIFLGRKDAQTCSPKCRKKLQRRRQKNLALSVTKAEPDCCCCVIIRLMKKLLLIAIAVVALLAVCYGGAVAIDNHYKNSQKQKAQAAPVITVQASDFKVASVKDADAKKYQTLVTQFNDQVAQCQKGLVAYAKLAPSVKAITPAPVCAAAVTQ